MSDEEFDAHVDKLFTARPATVAVSLRIAPDLLSRVKRQATLRGVPYQTFVKGIVEAAVSRLERGTRDSHGSSPIPGIGLVTACVVLAEVGEVGRFRSPDELCSWAGLTPTERSSDEHSRRGHISKQGSRWLRWVMVEAASTAVRNPDLRRWYERIERRRGKKIARIALARRLLTLCFYALRDQEGCRAFPARTRSRQLRPGALAGSHGLPQGTAAQSD